MRGGGTDGATGAETASNLLQVIGSPSIKFEARGYSFDKESKVIDARQLENTLRQSVALKQGCEQTVP
jgi:hypothetical protein